MLPSTFNKQMTHRKFRLSVFCFLPYVLSLFTCVCTGNVVINEIHYDPDVKTEAVEFIELYNTETTHIDLSGWHFSNGISYVFPAGAIISARGYVVVAFSPTELFAKWGGTRTGVSPDRVFGPCQGRLANDGETIELRNPEGDLIDRVQYQLGFPWPIVGDRASEYQPGTGYSIQLVNPFIDNDLAGSWRSGEPTPAARNERVYMDNSPPHIRQVRHTPKQPQSDEPVLITAKITDADGIARVTLSYQIVQPGHYINRLDSQYHFNWADLAMNDDGIDGDVTANDDIYTAQFPGSMQIHRRLIRYRITVEDSAGFGLLVPYADDPQPNFAYFVYDGVPAWSGAIQPGVTGVVRYGTDVMRSLPVYHLISKKSDVEDCIWFEHYAGSDYKWFGTLVYDGEVYDHIRYRPRGGVWRFAMGKNMWKFNFNRGHRFQARDNYGRKYATKWDKLNFSACIQQGSFGQRGEHGMFEALSNKLFNMAGVPTSKTNWVHFRIIDEPYEDGTLNAAHRPLTSRGTQYDGDFWGVYMTLEQMDGRFLDEHGLPDGNLYKMDGAYADGCKKNNQGPLGVADKSDVLTFRGNYSSGPSANTWGSLVNLDAYYGLYAIYNAVHHGDITSKNHYLYQNPEPTTNEWGTHNLWWQFVWDVDLTWTCYYGGMSDPFSRSGVLNHSEINVACRNRVREIVDLLFNSDQTDSLIDEFAAVINDPDGGPSIVDADRAMWDYHWVMGNAAYPQYLNRDASFKAGKGRFYEEAAQRGYGRSFEGMVQVMKDFVAERQSRMDSISRDSAIPRTPTITATGPSTYPINALTFETGAFSDPQGSHTFAAMQWRIAEVNPGSQVVSPDEGLVLIPDGAEWKYIKGTDQPSPRDRTGWRAFGFDDRLWQQGPTPIGWGEPSSFLATTLTGMQYQHTSFYVRKKFTVGDLSQIDSLRLEAVYDDGFNVWINGTFVLQENMPAEYVPYDGYANGAHSSEKSWFTFTLPEPTYLVEGENIIAIQVQNMSRTSSSDCFLNVRLSGKLDEPDAVPKNYRATEGKYEIDAAWESGPISHFDREITIPASRVEVGRTYRVRCRMKDNTGRWSHWSAPIQFETAEPMAAHILSNLRVTEVMYNPPASPNGDSADNDEFEFIELKNTGDEAIDLLSLAFIDGITFDFLGSRVSVLAPGDFVLVVGNEAALLSRYGTELSSKIAGEYTGRLSNNGERIRLVDFWNGTVADFTYGDGRGWPLEADAGGHSLVPLISALSEQANGSLNYPGNWRAGTYIGGSPGMDDPEPIAGIVLNEIAANTGSLSNDWIELYNPTAVSIHLQDWYLSDDSAELSKWAIPAVEIAGRSTISFDEITGFHNPADTGFGLNKSGEQVILSYLPGTFDDRIVDSVRFKAQQENISLGHYPDGGTYWLRMEPSRDSANVNPLLDVVIDEIMYHPPIETDDEYIELYNPTTSRAFLAMSDSPWRLDGAVEYTFDNNVSIPSGGRLIVVGFDPRTEPARLSTFVETYNTGTLTAGVDIVGPWAGNVSNAGERLALEGSLAPEKPDDPLSWVIVDEVIYSDVSPWPDSADGMGDVLQRILADEYHSGNDPDNWTAGIPSPGR